jgi:hypothetical protein
MKSVEQWQSSGGGLVVGGALHHGVVVMVVVVVWVEGVAKEVISGSSIHSPCHDIARKHTIIEGSLEVKLPTIWTDEKQSREEAERRDILDERRVEENE